MRHFTILFILISINCFSQIKIEKLDNNLEYSKPLKPVFKENININEYIIAEQFLGLVGKELLFLPSKNKTYSGKYESVSYLPKEKFKLNNVKYESNTLVNLSNRNSDLFNYLEIEGNYFFVDSIQFYDDSYRRKRITDFEFKEIKKMYLSQKYKLGGSIDIYTHHKKSNEIIIFTLSNTYDADKLILVPYFNYLKKKYLDKNIVLQVDGYGKYRKNTEIISYSSKFFDPTLIFKTAEIVLKEPKTFSDDYYTIFFRLKNSYNEIKEVEYFEIKDNLVFLNDYIARVKLEEKQDSIKIVNLESAKILEEKVKNEQIKQQKIKIEKAIIARREKFITKYGKYNGETIANNKVRIGMTKEMCEDSWGKPDSINRTTNSYGTSEQWVYGYSYLYFDNGKLTTIQN